MLVKCSWPKFRPLVAALMLCMQGILVAVLWCLICMGGRTRPNMCSHGHECRFANGRWSISTRGLCFECGDQRRRMSVGGASGGRKRYMFKQTSTSEPKAAHHRRFAEWHVPGRRVEAAAKTLLIETWAGRRSSVARWSARFGCCTLRANQECTLLCAAPCVRK